MINSIATLVGQPLWGMLSDKIRSIKKVFLFTIIIASLLIGILPFLENKYLVFLVLPLIQFFFCCLSPLLDSWTIQGIKNSGKSYGSFRLWGSIGFSLLVVINGKLISISFFNIIFIVYGIMTFATLILCTVFFKYNMSEGEVTAKKLTLKEMNVGRLLKNVKYTVFVVLSCITFINMTSVYSFLATLIRQVGGDDNLYGIANAVSAISEVPILLISSMLVRKFKPQLLIFAGMFVYAIRLFIYSVAAGPELIILSQALNGLSYGLFLSGSIYYIDFLAPTELKATAQTVATGVYYGLSGVIGNVLSGSMITVFGIFSVYRVGAVIQLCVSALFILSLLLGRKYSQAESDITSNKTQLQVQDNI